MKSSIVAKQVVMTISLIFLGAQMAATQAQAAEGELINNARVRSIQIGNNNRDGFAIILDGGIGVCTRAVNFYEPVVTTARWKAALALATTAMLSNKEIRAYSHVDGSNCGQATFIEIFD